MKRLLDDSWASNRDSTTRSVILQMRDGLEMIVVLNVYFWATAGGLSPC